MSDDHDLLVRIDERVQRLSTWTENHDSQHSRIIQGLVGALVTAAIALGTVLLSWVLR